jgi:hypothetical protein
MVKHIAVKLVLLIIKTVKFALNVNLFVAALTVEKLVGWFLHKNTLFQLNPPIAAPPLSPVGVLPYSTPQPSPSPSTAAPQKQHNVKLEN